MVICIGLTQITKNSNEYPYLLHIYYLCSLLMEYLNKSTI